METIKTLDPSVFKHLIMTIGELPSSFVESMTYYEMLAWLCNYIEKTVIPAVNNNAEAVAEIQHWIETLDLQDEVDHKLDEMAESGELAEIIAQYLQIASVLSFDNVNDMLNSENVIDGSVCETAGYYALGDGGGAKYLIRTITNEDVVDNIHLYAVVDDDTLVAELIKGDKINVKVYGAKGDGETDDTARIQAAINDLNTGTLSGDKESILFFPCGTYKVTDSLDFTGKKNSKITGKAEIIADMNKPILKIVTTQWLTFEDLYLRNINTSEGSSNIYIEDSYIIQFNHLYLRNGDIGLHIYSGNNLTFNSTTIRQARINIYTYSRGNNTGNSFNGCAIEDGTDYNFYVKFAAAYYGVYNFNNCYFEFSTFNAHIEQIMQVNFNGCYMFGQSANATFFEVDDFVAQESYLLKIYCNSCRLEIADNIDCYLVKSLNSNLKSCLTLDNNCYIRNTIKLYRLTDQIKPTVTCKNPELLDVMNSNSLVLDSSNNPITWEVFNNAPTVTVESPYFEGAENSITFGNSNGYYGKRIFLKAGVTYKIVIARKAGTGDARFDIFDDELATRLFRSDVSSTSPTVSTLYFVPETSARYLFLVRNTGNGPTSSFSGLKVYSLEPKAYNLF